MAHNYNVTMFRLTLTYNVLLDKNNFAQDIFKYILPIGNHIIHIPCFAKMSSFGKLSSIVHMMVSYQDGGEPSPKPYMSR